MIISMLDGVCLFHLHGLLPHIGHGLLGLGQHVLHTRNEYPDHLRRFDMGTLYNIDVGKVLFQ